MRSSRRLPSPPVNRQRNDFGKPESGWRRRAYEIIVESDTRAGRLFDSRSGTLLTNQVILIKGDRITLVGASLGGIAGVENDEAGILDDPADLLGRVAVAYHEPATDSP